MCQLCPSTMAQGQEPGGHWGSRAAPSESGRASFSPDGFLPGELLQWAPLDQAEAPRSPGGGGAEGAELKGVAPCGHLYRARPRTLPSAGAKEASATWGLSPDLHRAGRRSPTMSCSPVRASREQIWPLQLLFNIPEGKQNSPLRFFFGFWPLRTFSAMGISFSESF